MKIWTRTALLSLGFFVFPAAAGATYSIVAADTSTMWVGGAGTSCVGSLSVSVLLGAAPGRGAVHAQAALNTMGRDEAQRRIAVGESPEEALAAITSASFDPMAASRQYGAVDLMGRSAGYTGAQNMSFADDIQGDVDGFVYSIQGNILTSEKVLTQARDAFVEPAGCDLPDRLMLALEAAAENGEGDSRCTESKNIPSDSAFIRVVDKDGADVIFLDVTGSGSQNPLISLRQQFDAWRETHPCPEEDDSSTGTDDTTGTDESGDTENSDETGDESDTTTSEDSESTGDESDSEDDSPDEDSNSTSDDSDDSNSDTQSETTEDPSDSETQDPSDTSETDEQDDEDDASDNSDPSAKKDTDSSGCTSASPSFAAGLLAIFGVLCLRRRRFERPA